ncbi:MAG: glycosyltransferase [Demequina sp.]
MTAWRARESALVASGVDVSLVCARRWNEGGADVDLVPLPGENVVGLRTFGRHPNLFAYSPLGLWRALGCDPELLDIHEEPVSVATAQVRLTAWLRRLRVPYVLYSAQNIDKRYPVPFRWWERSALKNAAGAYVCNDQAGRILRAKGLRGPCVTVGLGVGEHEFAPAPRSSPTAAAPVVGYVGRLDLHKGVDVLLEAMVRVPHGRLEITGDGPRTESLMRQARALGVESRVAFLGHASGESLADRYRAVDVLAVPSRDTPAWREQFGRVAVEAMASGVPVVASDAGALPDVIGAAGLLVPQNDSHALASALIEATGSAWTDLRAAGIARARRNTWPAIAAQQRALYDSVCAPRPTPDPDVVVVAYGDPALLSDCLRELGGEFDVTVVDNSSSVRTKTIVEEVGGRYVDPGRNIGFGAGVNRALADLVERGRRHDVLLLNPDARIAPGQVRSMHAQLHASRQCAAVGASQTDPQTGTAVQAWWPFPTPAGAWVEALGLGRLRRRRGFIIGSILLLRAEAIEQLGGMDEQFFLYAEETDWQRRARDAGWTIALAEVAATHMGAGTGGDPGVREGHFYGSHERYVRKHHGATGWAVFRAANLAGAALRGVVLRGHRGQQARRRRRIYAMGPVRWESAS